MLLTPAHRRGVDRKEARATFEILGRSAGNLSSQSYAFSPR
jgi:hypothetical protein